MANENSAAAQRLNEQNAEFWHEQSVVRERRLADPTLAELAKRTVCSEAGKGLPIRWHTSFDEALAAAETTKATVLSELARKARKARKADALQQLIRDIVEQHPRIAEPQLLHMLAGERGAGVVTSIDGPKKAVREIHFTDDNGRKRESPVSGLKDRLSRARKPALTR
jgi:hypothetical protein